MNRIGIMQGRLSPPRRRLQSFPWSDWRDEFVRARTLGFDAIEWLFDVEDYTRNPLWSDAGISDIRERMQETLISVRSVCASYFLHHPFFRVSEVERRQSIQILERLIQRASMLDVHVVLLPVLESAHMRTAAEKTQLLESLSEPLDLAYAHGMTLALETSLATGEEVALLGEAHHPALGSYFDTGNATARGHDIAFAVQLVAPFLRGIHIKDRRRGGPNVALGTGDANFAGFFAALRSLENNATLILETTPGDDYYESARRNLDFVRSLLASTAA